MNKDNISKPPAVNMGIGALGDPGLIFVRGFRWAFEATHLPPEFIKKFSFDDVNNKIHLEIYQVLRTGHDLPYEEWKNNWDQNAQFTSFDGCGEELYKYRFHGLRLKSHKVDYDYSSSAEAVDVCEIEFDSCVRECTFLKLKPPVKKMPSWELVVGDKTYTLRNQKRPKMNVEEIAIQHKHSTMWIPGRSQWEELTFDFTADESFNRMELANVKDCELRLTNGTKVTERWHLHEMFTVTVNEKGKDVTWKVRFSLVEYQNH